MRHKPCSLGSITTERPKYRPDQTCDFKDTPYTLTCDKPKKTDRIKTGRNGMISSKITSKAQTTVPRAVRTALKLGVGDSIVYTIEGDQVMMTKAASPTRDSPTACYDEWDSENDRRAYANL